MNITNNREQSYSDLQEATYYLIRGSEIMSRVLLDNIPHSLTGLVSTAKRKSSTLEPIVRQLDANLDIGFEDEDY